MKPLFKKLVVWQLGRQVRVLRKRHQFKIVGVVGGIGKTSTKLAIAQTLDQNLRVRYQNGNYNDIVSVPLIFFGQNMPSLLNPLAWLKIFISNRKQIKQDYPYDVVVVELGTDAPGQISAFNEYLELDIVIITSVVPEHMANFADMRAVANEELAVAGYSKQVLYSIDFVAPEFRNLLPANSVTYSLENKTADFYVAKIKQTAGKLVGDIMFEDKTYLKFSHQAVSEMQLYSVLSAVAVAMLLGLESSQIKSGLNSIQPVSGRLRMLAGINSSKIIDDTYNASPEAVKAGLKALYDFEATHKIAILGNMNELGSMSEDAHKTVGELCDPKQLDLVVTIGPDANQILAPAAEQKGCKVQMFSSPYDAGEFLKSQIEPDTVILAKGSQNGVFAEEAVKLLLAHQSDANKLVRQSPSWLAKKRKAFKHG